MRRDFTAPILDLNSKPVQDAGAPVTLCTVALSALLASFPDEQALTGADKAERMQLALKINNRPREVDLTAEQLALLKKVIGKGFGPLAVGRAYELLEQEPRAVAALDPMDRPGA